MAVSGLVYVIVGLLVILVLGLYVKSRSQRRRNLFR